MKIYRIFYCFIFIRKKKLLACVVPSAPPLGFLRQHHLDRKEAEGRIARGRHIAPSIRQLRLPLHLDSRRKRIARTLRDTETFVRSNASFPTQQNTPFRGLSPTHSVLSANQCRPLGIKHILYLTRYRFTHYATVRI